MGGTDGIKDPRLIIDHHGYPDFSLVTRSSDGPLLFLVIKLVKMKGDYDKYPFGSRIAEAPNREFRPTRGVLPGTLLRSPRTRELSASRRVPQNPPTRPRRGLCRDQPCRTL
jgi:hypothetical protein